MLWGSRSPTLSLLVSRWHTESLPLHWGLYTILTKATNFHFIAIGYRRLDFRPVRWM